MTYTIVRFFQRDNVENVIIKTGLSLEDAQEHCEDPDTSWRTCTSEEGNERTRVYGPWFDGYRSDE